MRLAVAGTRLFFDVVGSELVPEGRTMRERPTLVLLHGGPGADHSIYRPAFDVLADRARLVYLDLRGQGRSDPDEARNWNLARWGDDVAAFCDALGVERPVVFGHSFGGMVAMAYATRHPQHPGGLVLSGTYARQDVALGARRCEELAGAEAGAAFREHWTAPSRETTARYDRSVLPLYARKPITRADLDGAFRVRVRPEVGLHFAADEMQRFDLRADLARIRCPTLVIGGTLDPVCPVEGVEEIAAHVPPEQLRFERLEEASHLLWIDQAERYFGALRAFLEGLEKNIVSEM